MYLGFFGQDCPIKNPFTFCYHLCFPISAQCPAGTYSQTGYQDMTCHPCPQNFYQSDPGQTTCVACDADKVTDGTGKTDSSSCLLYSDVHGNY